VHDTLTFILRNIDILRFMPLSSGAEGGLATLKVLPHYSRVLALPPLLSNEETARQFNRESVLYVELLMEAPYEKVGRITHFYSKASVAVLELTAPLNKGDKIVIRGSTTNIEQTVDSMEIEHKQVANAQAGQRVGMKVAGRVRENDVVYRVKQG